MAYYTVTGIVKRGIPVLLIAVVISTASGQMLHAGQDMLINFPVLLILIPPLAKIGGDTGSILGARLSSAFHLGLVDPIGGAVVRNSVLACLVIGFVSCIVYRVSCIVLSVAVWVAALLMGIKATYRRCYDNTDRRLHRDDRGLCGDHRHRIHITQARARSR